MISAHRAGVTVRAFLTGIADAGIIQLAQQSWQTIRKMKSLSNDGWNFVQILLTGIFTCQIACTRACLQMLKATTASIEKVSLGGGMHPIKIKVKIPFISSSAGRFNDL